MPSRSKSQYRFFKAIQNNPQLAKEKGISPSVAKDYTEGMTKQRFSKLKEKLKKK